MARPSSVTVEVEFVAGTWTDVSADVDWSTGWSFQVGRTSPQGIPQTSTLSVTLFSSTGKYTPGRQVLSDGSAAPYWPNVVPRKRLRTSVNGTVRWLGYIKGWYPQMVNGVLGKVVVQAADRFDALGRVNVLPPLRQTVPTMAPAFYWPLTDTVGSTSAVEVGGGKSLTIVGGSKAAFGAAGLLSGDGTALQLTPTSTGDTSGAFVTLPATALPGSLTWVMWFNPTSQLSGASLVQITDSGGTSESVEYGPTTSIGSTTGALTTLAQDNNWHMIAVTRDIAGTADKFYLDNVLIGGSLPLVTTLPITSIAIGNYNPPNAPLPAKGGFAQFAIWNRVLSSGELTSIYNIGQGSPGELVHTRIARLLGYAGLTGADYALDTSAVTLGSYAQGGKDVLAASQDASASEGGGSAFYVLAGTTTFKNRNARKPGAPALTLDAVRDLDRNVWQPAEDDATQLNQIIVSRTNAAGVQSTQTIDQSAGGQVLNTTLTTYTATDADALNQAQDTLSQNLTPGFRLPQVSVDLVTAENNLYTAAFTVGIGSRLRVTSIPTGQAPATQLDSIVEGWREEYSKANGIESYRMTFDTSPADTPPMLLWDDTTYGRWQGVSLFLRDTITSGATTLVVASSRTNLCSNGSFETNTTGWAAGGSVPPTLTQSAVRSFVGTKSMLITWGTGGSLPLAQATFTAVAGTVYTVSAKVWVPTGSPAVIWNIGNGGALSGTTALKDQWATISQTFTATASVSTTVQIWPGTAPTAGQQCFVDAVLFEASSSVNPYVDTTSGDATQPVFTVDGTQYPINIQIGAEIITLTAAPGTSTSPQTFTGVTRGVNGTTASAQSGTTALDVYQPATWGL